MITIGYRKRHIDTFLIDLQKNEKYLVKTLKLAKPVPLPGSDTGKSLLGKNFQARPKVPDLVAVSKTGPVGDPSEPGLMKKSFVEP